jgi:hypothetical protein
MLANEIIPARREIVIRAVTNELGAMMQVTASSVRGRLLANQHAATELSELSGKSKDMVARLWRKISQDKEEYNAALTEYKAVRGLFQVKHSALSDDDSILGAWTRRDEDRSASTNPGRPGLSMP